MEILAVTLLLPGIIYLLAVTDQMAATMLDLSVLVLFLYVIRILFRKRISGELMYSLWVLIPIRLLGGPLLKVLRSLLERQDNIVVNATDRGLELFQNIIQSGNETLVSGVEPVRLDLRAVSLPVWFWCVWAVGIAAVYLWSVYVNETFRHRLFEQRIRITVEGCQYQVYKVPGIASSCVMKVNGEKGIYLTETVAEDEEKREYVLTHELCHLKHKDLFWGNLRCIVLACNWFNPLIWAAAFLSKRDGETACDERSIRVLGEAKRYRYGRVLLDMLPDKEKINLFFTATTMGGGKRELVYRVCRIAESRNRWIPSIVVLVLTFFLACMIGFVPSSADLRGLSPEETVRQYLYYWNQNYREGMRGLRVDGGSYNSHGTVTIRKCGKTTEVENNDVDIDGTWSRAENKWADAQRLSLEIQIEYIDYNLGNKEQQKERSKEEFIVIRESTGTDWRILETTLDDFCEW
ncbi:MAG: hypothetical protein HFG34_11360 [Eubacterium sp.]|nr:hypothetical protein [Eubacterium sp.]